MCAVSNDYVIARRPGRADASSKASLELFAGRSPRNQRFKYISRGLAEEDLLRLVAHGLGALILAEVEPLDNGWTARIVSNQPLSWGKSSSFWP